MFSFQAEDGIRDYKVTGVQTCLLGLVFGATTLAWSTVLAAFMGGLALGSALAGRFASRITKPVAAYGWMEIGIAVYALLVPLLFHAVVSLYASVWQQLQPGFF